MTAPLKTKITHDGQRYVDEPIYETLHPRRELTTPLAQSVAEAFGHQAPAAIHALLGHERVRLRWMTSDGKGGLKPREKQ